jgi:REP-associated tyrosine transposase
LGLAGATYFITACLEGSIPAQGLFDIREFHDRLMASRPEDRSPDEWREYAWKQAFVEQERWLDDQPAVRHLENPELARCVANSLRFFHQTRYELIAYVVMPSHFHWLFRPLEEWASTLPEDVSAREVIMHSIKSYTAHQCNLDAEHFRHFLAGRVVPSLRSR